MTTKMTQIEMFRAFRARGCKVTPRDVWHEGATVRGVIVSLSAMGSMEVHTIREGEEIDPDAIVKGLRAELAVSNKRTRGAIRAERERN